MRCGVMKTVLGAKRVGRGTSRKRARGKGDEDEGVELLRRLVRDFSVKTLAEKTGVAEGVLAELLAFERDRPDGALEVIGGCLWTGRCGGRGVIPPLVSGGIGS